MDEIGRDLIEAGYFPEYMGGADIQADGTVVDEAAIALEAISEAVAGRNRFLNGEGPDQDLSDFAALLSERAIDLSMSNDEIVAALQDDGDGQQYDQDGRLLTDTPEFRAWFGDSKVVDENGDPLVVYHGTQNSFDQFESGSNLEGGSEGIFFTDDYDLAVSYSNNADDAVDGGGGVFDVYLKIENPLIYDAKGAQWTELGRPDVWVVRNADGEIVQKYKFERDAEVFVDDYNDDFVEEYGIDPKEYGEITLTKERDEDADAVTTDELFSQALEDGHDGVIVQNVFDIGGTESGAIIEEASTVYITRDPEQIKSIHNRGTFDANDPRILFQDQSHPFDGVTRDEFLGSPKITSNANASSLVPKVLASVEPVESVPFNAGVGLTAKYHENGAAVLKGDKVIASYNLGDTLVVAKGHRRKGIAEELVYQWRMRFPQSQPATSRTKASQKLQEKVWDRIQSEIQSGQTSYNQDKRGSIVLPRGGLKEGQTVINLFEGADLSTFLHESGHFFLEAFTALATSPDAPQALRDDLAVIHKFLKVEDGAALQVDQHETWARGFEAYLMEGKAPSLELASAFSRFKAWLGRSYRSIAGLNVNLTPEIREVMDRMLATDAEIAAMREDLGMRPLFTDAAPVGMSDTDFATYQRMARRGSEQAEASLMNRTMEKVRRETQSWFKAEKKAVHAEVEASVNKMPVYRLTEMATNQKWLGDTDQDIPDIQIDRDLLVEQFGEGVIAELGRSRIGGKRAIYAKGGERPESVASMFGFENAGAMIEALQNSGKRKDFIAAEVDRIMVERHGDPLNDGSIEEAAALAVHSDQQSAMVTAEARAIAKRLGRPTRDIKAKVYAQGARAMLGRMSVREASRPAAFLQAERRAAKTAEQAFARVARGGRDVESSLATAMQAKEQQILNQYLYREAREFETSLQRGRERMQSYAKKTVRAKLDGGYIEQIDALLDRFDFRVRSKGQVERSESLRDYMDRMIDEGREAELSIDARLADESRKTHYTRLSVDELQGFFDTVANIDHMGRFKQKLVHAKDARDLAETVSGVVGAMNANIKGRKPGRTETSADRSRKVGRDYLNLTLNADTLLREIDGFGDMGPAWSTFKERIDTGMARLTERRLEMAKQYDAIYSAYSAKEQRDMSVKRHHDGLGDLFSKWDIIAIALNTGNEDNYQRLTNPKTQGGFTPEQVDAALADLDARDWKTVQAIWDHINSFWPEIEAKERRTTGVAPPKVEAKVMSSAAPASVSGGYYPIKYDSRLSGRVGDLEMKDLANSLIGGRFGKAQTRNGHTKERVRSVSQPLLLDLSVAHAHTAQVLYDIELGEAVSSSWRVLQDARVKDAFLAKGKKADHEALEIWLQDVASGDQVASRGLEKYMRHLRTGFVVSRLAMNVSTALIQPSGLVQSAVVVGKRAIAKGTIDFMKNPARWTSEVAAVSPLMRERQVTFERDIFNVVGDLEGGPVSGRWAKFQRDVVLPLSFLLMQKVQFYAVDMPTWVGAYQKELGISGDEAKARLYADTMVKRAQGSGLMSDRGMLERGTLSMDSRQREFPRMLTALGSYMCGRWIWRYCSRLRPFFIRRSKDTCLMMMRMRPHGFSRKRAFP